jgi:predicted RNA binding protein YcfA (HicA-like mRNA interferase family)
MREIDYARLRSFTVRRMITALLRDGFYLDRQSGGHHQYCHPDGRRVTVSFHRSNETFSRKILQIIIERQAKWTDRDLRRLRIL